MTDYEKAKEILSKYGQEHLLLCYKKMTDENKSKLLGQILEIDFEQINELYGQTKNPKVKKENNIEPIPYIDKSKITNVEIQSYTEKGVEEIKNGKLAVVTMAGGQGTRLRALWTERNIHFAS